MDNNEDEHWHSQLKNRRSSPHHPTRRYQPDIPENEYKRADTARFPPHQPGDVTADTSTGIKSDGFNPPLYLRCGPLLRFAGVEEGVWRGSVMIVTEDKRSMYERAPEMRVYRVGDAVGEGGGDGLTKLSRTGRAMGIKTEGEVERGVDYSVSEGLFQETDHNNQPDAQEENVMETGVTATRLHTERGVTFWRFNLSVTQSQTATHLAYRINNSAPQSFYIPAVHQATHIMFHSCNGFSLSVDTKGYSGPDPLWRDVLREHTTNPFHVMLGGGDQIYNDECRLKAKHFNRWTETRNRLRKRHASFTAEMQSELEEVYLDRYMWWFSQGLFGVANAHIPMVNIWDDHDIIDGYGSYPPRTMSTPVFTGLGAVACKYYLLFQHQCLSQETAEEERSWVLGRSPGPYIREVSRSVFMRLGPRIAFLGVDARMERTRYRVCYEETWRVLLDRCKREIGKDGDAGGEVRHLIVLLGVPIIYPRLSWLETVLSSRAMAPLKALGRRGFLGSLFNKFDGGIEVLDDLDDHWTTKRHRSERRFFILEMQRLARESGVRVSILAGDVHLGAVGEFTTKQPKKGTGKGMGREGGGREKDHRYMPNIISSAIANRPPSSKIADILNRCDRIHHPDKATEEKMVPMFDVDVDGSARRNTHLLPRRNWCAIEERTEMSTLDGDGGADGHTDGNTDADGDAGEGKGKREKGVECDLDVQLHVEMDPGDPAGRTRAYGLVVPGLRD